MEWVKGGARIVVGNGVALWSVQGDRCEWRADEGCSLPWGKPVEASVVEAKRPGLAKAGRRISWGAIGAKTQRAKTASSAAVAAACAAGVPAVSVAGIGLSNAK